MVASSEPAITASMAVSGDFARGYSWNFKLSEDRSAVLTIQRWPTPAQKRLIISENKIRSLRKAVVRERFFDLRSSYGDLVPDGHTTTVTISLGAQTKTVQLHFLRHEDPLLPEIQRAVRVALVLRDFFQHPDAVDLRRYDKMMLKSKRR